MPCHFPYVLLSAALLGASGGAGTPGPPAKGRPLERRLAACINPRNMLETAHRLAELGARAPGSSGALGALRLVERKLLGLGLLAQQVRGPLVPGYHLLRLALGGSGEKAGAWGEVFPWPWSPGVAAGRHPLRLLTRAGKSFPPGSVLVHLSASRGQRLFRPSRPRLEALKKAGAAALLLAGEQVSTPLPLLERGEPPRLLPLPVILVRGRGVARLVELLKEPAPSLSLELLAHVGLLRPVSLWATLKGAGGGPPALLCAALEGRGGGVDLSGSAAPAAVLLEVARVLGLSRRGPAPDLPPLKGDIIFGFLGHRRQSLPAWIGAHPELAPRIAWAGVVGPLGPGRALDALHVVGALPRAQGTALDDYQGQGGFWEVWQGLPWRPEVIPFLRAFGRARALLPGAHWLCFSSAPLLRPRHLDAGTQGGNILVDGFPLQLTTADLWKAGVSPDPLDLARCARGALVSLLRRGL